MPINIPVGICVPMSCKNDETFTKILDMINAYADDIINEIYQI